eukprot:3271926-Pleurochrysis_carterae.AAC.1
MRRPAEGQRAPQNEGMKASRVAASSSSGRDRTRTNTPHPPAPIRIPPNERPSSPLRPPISAPLPPP